MQESGICPSCRDEGEVAAPCPEKGCRGRGYHFVPRAYATEPRLDPEIGLLLEDRYLLVARLGEGGFGKVFVALDRRLDTKVALKLLKTVDDPQAHDKRSRLIEVEAKILARLSHPNIVQMKGYGFFEGAPYIVLEFIEGGKTLAREVARRARAGEPLPLAEVEAILAGVLHGLEEAHSLQIIHRDVKPDNIMLQAKPGHPVLPRILDFGIAKLADTTSQSSSITGTPDYMAPEQISRGDIGPWTDLYALGVMAYELMTGRRPFHGDFVAILSAKCDPDFDVLAAVADLKLSATVRAFLKKALAFRPSDRFRTAPEFRAALSSAFHAHGASKVSVDLTALVTSERLGVRTPLRPRRGLLLGIAIGTAVLGTALSIWLATHSGNISAKPGPELGEAAPDVVSALSAPDAAPAPTALAATPTQPPDATEPDDISRPDVCAVDCITALQDAFGLRAFCDEVCRGPSPPRDTTGFIAATRAALRRAPATLDIGSGRTARAHWEDVLDGKTALVLDEDADLGAFAVWAVEGRNAKLVSSTRLLACEGKTLDDWASARGAQSALWACLVVAAGESKNGDWPMRKLTLVDPAGRTSTLGIAVDPESELGKGSPR